MDYSHSIFMALMDFIPVLGFIIGIFYLTKVFTFSQKLDMVWMVITGGGLIFFGGGLQATWKLFKALNIGDFQWMSQGQFIFMALGYSFFLISLFSLSRTKILAENISLTAMTVWKIPFLIIMTLASLGTYGILAYIAFRRRLTLAGISFSIALLGVILMGGMASQTQSIAMQWIEQSVNSFSNICFAVGCFLLFKDFEAIISPPEIQ